MKKVFYTLFLSLLVLLSAFTPGCNESDTSKTLKPDEDAVYMQITDIEKEGVFVSGLEKLNEAAFLQKLRELPGEAKQLNYRVFISEQGKLDYVRLVEKVQADERDNLIMESVLKTSTFKKVEREGKGIKYQFPLLVDISSGLVKNKDNQKYHVRNKVAYYTEADEMPMPVGGISTLVKNVVYPPNAKAQGLQGKVLVEAYIDVNGNVTHCEVFQGAGDELNKAAIEAVRKTPFTSGMKNGKKVNMKIVIPILFKLQ